MYTVESVDEIWENLETMRGYLYGSNQWEREKAVSWLGAGKNFVVGTFNGGGAMFGPSRFMGYTRNYVERHCRLLPLDHPDAFHGHRPDGGETTRKINKILDRITHGQPEWEDLESSYLGLCTEVGANPSNYAEGNERTFWNLADDSEFVDLDRTFVEGRRYPASVMRSERCPAARAACIAYHELSCFVCGFNFEDVYGEHGRGFIHVHHRNPLAQGEAEVDPIEDLCPVCPNCHYMLHRGETLLSPEELQEMLQDQ